MIGNLLSKGTAELVKNVGGVIDNLHTSAEEKQVLNHEMRHATDMKIGKLSYSDDFVKWNGNTYPRRTINGKDMIIVDGVAKEAGTHDFPWEEEANTGNGNI